ncbi:MAG: hypothetical protein QXW13_00030 [Nanopusillaceae archaeon]
MRYPIHLSDQIKFLIENENFFKTFGKYTEPYPNKFVRWIADQYKDNLFEIHKEFYKLPPAEKSSNYYYTVKFIEDNMVSGGCMTASLFAASVFRSAGYPAAILVGVAPESIFDSHLNFKDPILKMHAVCLAKVDNSWYIYDMTKGTSSRFIFLGMLSSGFIPGLIIRDLEDLGISNKKQMFGLLMYNLKDVLLLDLQKDILFKKFYKYYENIKKSILK